MRLAHALAGLLAAAAASSLTAAPAVGAMTATTTATTRATGTTAAGTAATGPTAPTAALAGALPGTTPIRNRPQFHGDSAVVEAVEQVGSRVVVAGHGITSYSQGNGTTVTSTGAGLTATAANDPTRVAWTGPAGGQWYSLLPASDGTHVWAGSSTGVSSVDVSTGRQTWTRPLGGKVTTIEQVPGTTYLIVAGSFPGGIAVLRRGTGADAPYAVPELNKGGRILHADVQPHGNHWVGVGTFTSVGGKVRSQAVMLTLSATSASVTAWDVPLAHGPDGTGPCAARYQNFLHDVAFTHDGSAFFLVGTGARNSGMCDAVSRFETRNISLAAAPTWITGTCTDTFWSVGVSPDDSYLLVGGHFKCIGMHHLPTSGTNVSRFALAALDPVTGDVLPWKADKCRAVGTREISWISGGVAIGYDCKFFGNSESVNPEPTPQTPRDRFAVLPLP